jgi:hypothetical protein
VASCEARRGKTGNINFMAGRFISVRKNLGAFPALRAGNRAFRSKSSDLPMQILWAFHFNPWRGCFGDKIHHELEEVKKDLKCKNVFGVAVKIKKYSVLLLCILPFFLWACASLPEEPSLFQPSPKADSTPLELREPVPQPEPVPDISAARLPAPSASIALAMPEPVPEARMLVDGEEIAGLPAAQPVPQPLPVPVPAPPLPPVAPAPVTPPVAPAVIPAPAAAIPAPVAGEASPARPLTENAARQLPEPRQTENPSPSSLPGGGDSFFPPAEGVATITLGTPRRISGIEGRSVSVTLPGIGWIYLPGDDAEGKIRYIGKVMEEGNTVFSFALLERGDYNLKFQQQDLAANTMRYDDVELAVNPSEAARQQPSPAAPPASAAPAAPAPPVSTPVEPSPPATPPQPAENENELQMLQRLVQEGQSGALARLETYVGDHQAEIPDLDELYFYLAGKFEQDTPERDMKKSLLYYEKVRDLFPLSRRWIESDTKSRYIRVNYFDIR